MMFVLSLLVCASLLPALTEGAVQLQRKPLAWLSETNGTVYTRWGSKDCSSSVAMVYSGYMAGSHYTHAGSGANYLCLPPNPVLIEVAKPAYVATLWGVEYEVTNRAENNFDALCAVCFISGISVNIMIPGTNKCPTGWTSEYTGLLMTGYDGHPGSTEYICVDTKLEGRIASNADQNGRLLYYAATMCGSLPCSPYLNNNILQCVVCSK